MTVPFSNCIAPGDRSMDMYACEWATILLHFLTVVCNQWWCQTQCFSFITVIGLSCLPSQLVHDSSYFSFFLKKKINKQFVVPLIERNLVLPYYRVDIFNIYPPKRPLGLPDLMHRFWINWVVWSQGCTIMRTHFIVECRTSWAIMPWTLHL